ncbi:MAG: PHB depolymerase family esterase, partial [Bacteroidales bacterium]|nr:PHB depolymerase family esterase [Bacteroidales bacterium]
MISKNIYTFKYYLLLSLFSLIVQSISAQITNSFIYDSQNRSYITYLPSAFTQGTSLPVVLIYHGYGQTADNMMLYSQFNQLAETHDFIAVYPQGINNSWNVGLVGNSTSDDIGFTDALIDTLYSKYSIDLLRVYACGMSNGGFFSHLLACQMSDRIAAIASVTGSMTILMESNCQQSRAVPVLQIHGTADAVVPYSGASGVLSVDALMQFWANKNNCAQTPTITNITDINSTDLCTVEKHHYTPCAGQEQLILYKVINGGHTWPGGFPVASLGNTNQDINASAEIWDFFNNFSLPASLSEHIQDIDLVQIYPNPVYSGKVSVNNNQNEAIEIFLINSVGQVLKDLNIKAKESMVLELNMYSKGIYIIKAKSK